MSDTPNPPKLKRAIDEWLTFRRTQTIQLRRSYRIPIPTLGGPTLWEDIRLNNEYRLQRHHITQHCRILNRKDRRVFWGTEAECESEFSSRESSLPVSAAGQHLVLCLHGMFRSKNAMNPMRNTFIKAGFNAWSINYPSTLRTIAQHANQIARLLENCEGVTTVSFVCHSLGGLIARALLADPNAQWRQRIKPYRLVMIGTPNQGAFIARQLSEKTRLFRLLAGPSGLELSPEWVNELPVPNIEFGIIAGGTGTERGFNPFLPGDNDMTVTVQSAQLEGSTDYYRCKSIHTFIMQNKLAMNAAVRFVATGQFREESTSDSE